MNKHTKIALEVRQGTANRAHIRFKIFFEIIEALGLERIGMYLKHAQPFGTIRNFLDFITLPLFNEVICLTWPFTYATVGCLYVSRDHSVYADISGMGCSFWTLLCDGTLLVSNGWTGSPVSCKADRVHIRYNRTMSDDWRDEIYALKNNSLASKCVKEQWEKHISWVASFNCLPVNGNTLDFEKFQACLKRKENALKNIKISVVGEVSSAVENNANNFESFVQETIRVLNEQAIASEEYLPTVLIAELERIYVVCNIPDGTPHTQALLGYLKKRKFDKKELFFAVRIEKDKVIAGHYTPGKDFYACMLVRVNGGYEIHKESASLEWWNLSN
jgi:hypothetical protein